jgi:putative FmdB family regulatory protein
MPIYEYLCTSCGKVTEALQRIADPPLTVCPHCQGTLRKQLSAPAFQFKGSGWYVTDYARKSGSGSGASGSEKAGTEKAGFEKAGSESSKSGSTDASSSKPSGDGGSGAKPAGGSGSKE